MSRKNEPNIIELLEEKERNQKLISWYKYLVLDLTDYIITNGDEEHLIESLLDSNYTPHQLVYDIEFDATIVEEIVKLKGHNV